MDEKQYVIPEPIIDKKEETSLESLKVRYGEISKPGVLSKTGDKVKGIIPKAIKKAGKNAKDSIAETELFAQCMEVVAKGFHILESQTANMSISETAILKRVNGVSEDFHISSLDELCLVRGYELSKLVNKYRKKDTAIALVEGSATGAFGFKGLPFNIVLGTFLFYRAVQSVAMFYGYDVKNNVEELMIATEIFTEALSPNSRGQTELGSVIGKIMVMAEVSAVKQTAKKTWTDMAARGGTTLLLAQMRALANKSARKALENAGKKGIEGSLFKGVFEQIGKELTMKSIQKSVPIVGAVIGGLFDTAQMRTVLEYADIFYNQRFLLEKEVRINILVSSEQDDVVDSDVIDVDFADVEGGLA